MIVVLDAQKIKTREELHAFLAEAFQFPEWYGQNLDALYDCLTDFPGDAELFILHRDLFPEQLGNYGKALCKVLKDVAEANPHLTIHGLD